MLVRNFTKSLLGGLLGMCFTSCTSGYQIEGTSTVGTLDGRMLYLKTLTQGEWCPVDSSEVLHGMFKMNGEADSVRMVSLCLNDESLMPLILENGHISVTISPAQLSVKGTPLNDALYEFIRRRNEIEAKIMALDRKEARMVLEGISIDEARKELSKEADQLTDQLEDHIRTSITSHYQDVLGPTIFLLMGSAMPYPILTPLAEEILRSAPADFLRQEQVKEFVQTARENKQRIEEHQRMQENQILQAAQKKQKN